MLDLQFIRDNPELVQQKAEQKGYPVDVQHLLELDRQVREHIQKLEKLQQERNEQAAKFKNSRPTESDIEAGKYLKGQINAIEDQLADLKAGFEEIWRAVPNMPLNEVPIGSSEEENQVVREWGTKKEFDFQPKTHWELAEPRDLIDKTRAAKVASSRFAYIKGALVELQFAIIQFVMDSLSDERVIEHLVQEHHLEVSAKPFIPVLPPLIVNTEAYERTGRLNAEEVTYKLADDEQWLNASAEHSLSNMYMDEILAAAELPIRYIGYATSFRREAGSYGKDNDGIIRMHQFDKLEMEVFSTPESGEAEHHLLVAIEEYLVQQLELPYRVLQKCTADIGKPNAQGIDLEIWMPGQNAYRETHSADYMTDYQARSLQTRYRKSDGNLSLVHTNDATAFALGRTLVAIMENYQTHDGHIIIPERLRTYMRGKEEI